MWFCLPHSLHLWNTINLHVSRRTLHVRFQNKNSDSISKCNFNSCPKMCPREDLERLMKKAQLTLYTQLLLDILFSNYYVRFLNWERFTFFSYYQKILLRVLFLFGSSPWRCLILIKTSRLLLRNECTTQRIITWFILTSISKMVFHSSWI